MNEASEVEEKDYLPSDESESDSECCDATDRQFLIQENCGIIPILCSNENTGSCYELFFSQSTFYALQKKIIMFSVI